MRTDIAARYVVAIPAVGVVAFLALNAVRLGMAGEIVYRSAQEIAAWNTSAHWPDGDGVDRLVSSLEKASRLAPDDPNAEELLGALAARHNDRPGSMDEALAHYERAIELRPTSPYSWADVVSIEYRRGEAGVKIQAAMRNAAMLGPAEPEVQRTVIDYGLALWDDETPDARKVVEKTITDAMRREPAETLQIADRRGRLAVACRHLADAPRRIDPEWRLSCRGRGEQ